MEKPAVSTAIVNHFFILVYVHQCSSNNEECWHNDNHYLHFVLFSACRLIFSWAFQELRDDDIKDDVTCAKRIFRQHHKLSGNGFNAWYDS